MISLAGLALLLLAGTSEDALAPRELAHGVFVLASSSKYGSANQGWVVLEDRIILIGVPHPTRIARVLEQIATTSSKPVRAAVVLQFQRDDVESALALARRGIEIHAQKDGAKVIQEAGEKNEKLPIHEFDQHIDLGDPQLKIEVRSHGPMAGPGVVVAYLPQPQILFAGATCIHGPRAELTGINTLAWLSALGTLQTLPCRTVVPGRGSVGDASLLEREVRFLREFRRQVGHLVAQASPLDAIVKEVKITPEYLVWMPYDHPTREDIEHVYHELTVPLAPFGDLRRPAAGPGPKALVLIGDSPHDPDHIEAGLSRALGKAGIAAYTTVDVRSLTSENLKQVQLFVILRDGAIWPNGRDKPSVSWMTPDQEEAVVNFVERGGGFLVLHNSTALYPERGPYLKLVGGTYEGHGTLERFRVSVVDRAHPITRGVNDFEVADEQHTPTPDRARVHLLLESRSAEGTVGAAGWVHQAGKGRVCYLANGHTRDALDHPEFQKLVRNAALWCLGTDEGHPPK